jgi:hypothetical protein
VYTKKVKLYAGDSSDEDIESYSKNLIIENVLKLSKTDKTGYISSFILQEISQSILESPNVTNSYNIKKE